MLRPNDGLFFWRVCDEQNGVELTGVATGVQVWNQHSNGITIAF